jgi:hypothetical protein
MNAVPEQVGMVRLEVLGSEREGPLDAAVLLAALDRL